MKLTPSFLGCAQSLAHDFLLLTLYPKIDIPLHVRYGHEISDLSTTHMWVFGRIAAGINHFISLFFGLRGRTN